MAGQERGEGLSGGGGDGGVAGDLVVFVVVDHLGSEDAVELLLEFGGGVVQDAGELGQPVEEGRVVHCGGGGGDLGELGVDGGALVFEFGEPLQYAGAQGCNGG